MARRHVGRRRHVGGRNVAEELREGGGELGLRRGAPVLHVRRDVALERRVRALGQVLVVHVELLQQLLEHRLVLHVGRHFELQERRVDERGRLVQLFGQLGRRVGHAARLEEETKPGKVALVRLRDQGRSGEIRGDQERSGR